jgi:shikimate kinase
VSEIFDIHGEKTFRDREWECVKRTFLHERVIVSCGGGAPCFHDAIGELCKHGFVIYLKTSVPVLIERLASSSEQRPLLADDPAGSLGRLLEEREHIYHSAHHIIDTDALGIDGVVEAVLKAVMGRGAPGSQ